MSRLLCVFLLLLAACGGRQASTQTSAGGPTTVAAPIPVPAPVYPREQMSTELQLLWGRVEEAVAVQAPAPPELNTLEAIDEWARGPFEEWLIVRRAATDRALQAAFALRARPLFERAIGTALFGYMYEDLASGIRGAPVPDSISADPGLLQIYTTALDEHLLPFAELSARAYYSCLALFSKLGDVAWMEWAAYCDERGAEVVELFHLEPPEPIEQGGPSAEPLHGLPSLDGDDSAVDPVLLEPARAAQ
jgi:hypothetical protein